VTRNPSFAPRSLSEQPSWLSQLVGYFFATQVAAVRGLGPAGHSIGSSDGLAAEDRPRKERDCPRCAEPILEQARICKHCGGAVEALTSSSRQDG
jgi:hypothetical protein